MRLREKRPISVIDLDFFPPTSSASPLIGYKRAQIIPAAPLTTSAVCRSSIRSDPATESQCPWLWDTGTFAGWVNKSLTSFVYYFIYFLCDCSRNCHFTRTASACPWMNYQPHLNYSLFLLLCWYLHFIAQFVLWWLEYNKLEMLQYAIIPQIKPVLNWKVHWTHCPIYFFFFLL